MALHKAIIKSLIAIYKQFRARYSFSVYISHMKPQIELIEDYYQDISGEMPKDVKFIEAGNINTIEELAKNLKGEKYYVDVWATWCIPCLEEFEFNSELYKLLESKGYKILYLSVDKSDRKDKWQKYINFYELEGLHIIANKKLFSTSLKIIPEPSRDI